MEKHSTMLFVDASGSTSGSEYYHTSVLSIMDTLPEETKIWRWGSSVESCSKQKLIMCSSKKIGNLGATEPWRFSHLAEANQHIIIITDGQVNKRDIERVDKVLQCISLVTRIKWI